MFYKQIDSLKIETLTIPIFKEKNSVFRLDRIYLKRNANYSYVFKTEPTWMIDNIEKNTSEILRSNSYTGIIFRVIGTHSLSNITSVFERKYSFTVERGQFQSGNTMNIIECE